MIVLVGKSSSGKDSILNVLCDKFGYKPIISYTTRPRRKSDIKDVTYHFIPKNEFLDLVANDFFAEMTDNYHNYYGIAKDDCLDESIVIVDRHGLEQLRKVEGLNIMAFYLSASPLTRFVRMIKRGDKLLNVFKRILIDDVKFLNAKKSCDWVLKSKNGEGDNLINAELISYYLDKPHIY